ncbi:P-loop containing nucleoside triphosphate hydrolase protein [Rhizophagus clarus]|nr:P-loop containing nucleoside triphosphate hydrolase protein [Rhizophagus clarus]
MFSQPQKFAIRNSNPVLFQSSLSRSYTNSTVPPLSPQDHSSSSPYLNKFVKATAKWLSTVIIGKLVVAGVISLLLVDFLHAGYRNRRNKYLLNKTVEKGTQPDIMISEDKFVPRTEVIERLKKILQPNKDQSSYYVVCGEHGTGKTMLTRIASREVGQGVIYVEIPSDPKDKNIELFGKAFGESINFEFEEHISFIGQLKKKILGYNVKIIEHSKWRRALEAFKSAGAVYRAKHNKLPVIVYDNISEIMSVDPEVLDALQNDAKMNADHKRYIAVFVSSEDSVPRRMQSRSAWSRAEEPIEIGDLTRDESLDYLINKRGIKTVKEGIIDTTEAERIYELVGGRITELNSVANKLLDKGKNLENIKKKYFIKIEDKLRTAKLLKGDEYHETGKRVIKALLDSKELNRITYEEFFKNREEANKILAFNIFTYHPEKNTVTFQSKLVECYILENANIFLK